MADTTLSWPRPTTVGDNRGVGLKGWLAGPTDKTAQPRNEAAVKPALADLDTHKIAVLPLVNISPSPADEYFADGLTEEFISSVSKIPGLRTISRTSIMRYKGTSKSVEEIARELNVGTVLEGSVRKAGNRLRITMQLIDVKRDEPLCSESYDRDLEDVLAIQIDIANCVAKALEVRLLAPEKRRIEKRATTNIEAYTLYLRALHSRGAKTEEGFRKAIEYFLEALQKDEGFARAYEGLADCFERMGEAGMLPPEESFPTAGKYAEKALKLDDSLAEAHATLGAVLEEYYFDQAKAEREFKRALSLNPNFGRVCQSYGAHLACVGKLDEAVREIGRAQELNPLALEVNECAAVIFNCANQTDRSLEFCERMLETDENYFPAYEKIAEAYIQKSRLDDAIEALQKSVAISNGAATVKGRLGFAYACAGRKNEARRILLELEEDSGKRYISPMAIALVYCGLGEKDQAIKWLEKSCEERAGGVITIKVRPIWASLRSEPRFIRLLDKMGLNA
jgi:TolB-like protein/lipopolysaccharide biosynthesis regulator YciM